MSRPLLVALAAVLLVALAGVLWAVFGRAPDTVQGRGIILPAGGYTTLTAPAAGLVDAVVLAPGQQVGRGRIAAWVRLAGGRRVAVTTPTAGRVVDVLTDEGTQVRARQPVALMSPAGSRKQVRALLPMGESVAVQPGMRALVSPAGIRSAEHGAVEGVVTSVSPSAVGAVRLRSISGQNPWVERYLAPSGPVAEATIALVADTRSATGVRWTIGAGPDAALRSGQLASVSVTVSDPPIINRLVR